MAIYPKLIEKLIGQTTVGFNNAKTNPEIKERILKYGYNDEKLDGHLQLIPTTRDKYQEFERLSGEQLKATKNMEELLKSEKSQYSLARKIALRVFNNESQKGIRSQLGIDLSMKKSFDGFIERVYQFYDAALDNPEILQGLAAIDLTTEKIQERLNGLSQLRRLNEVQESAKGKAKVSKKERDDAYKTLKSAWVKFRIVCLSEFKTDTEYLKLMDIPPLKKRSGKSTPQENPDQQPTPPAPGE